MSDTMPVLSPVGLGSPTPRDCLPIVARLAQRAVAAETTLGQALLTLYQQHFKRVEAVMSRFETQEEPVTKKKEEFKPGNGANDPRQALAALGGAASQPAPPEETNHEESAPPIPAPEASPPERRVSSSSPPLPAPLGKPTVRTLDERLSGVEAREREYAGQIEYLQDQYTAICQLGLGKDNALPIVTAITDDLPPLKQEVVDLRKGINHLLRENKENTATIGRLQWIHDKFVALESANKRLQVALAEKNKELDKQRARADKEVSKRQQVENAAKELLTRFKQEQQRAAYAAHLEAASQRLLAQYRQAQARIGELEQQLAAAKPAAQAGEKQ